MEKQVLPNGLLAQKYQEPMREKVNIEKLIQLALEDTKGGRKFFNSLGNWISQKFGIQERTIKLKYGEELKTPKLQVNH